MTIRATVRGLVLRAVHRLGYQITRLRPERDYLRLQGIASEFDELYEDCRRFTQLNLEKLTDLYIGATYLLGRGIPGAFVECGVGPGGVGRLLARILARHGSSRHLYLYDTYSGMPRPGRFDRAIDWLGSTLDRWEQRRGEWLVHPLQQVRPVVLDAGLPAEHVHFVEGLVEETIPGHAPEEIALLHLDTDFYESTAHELRHLFPRLSQFGVIAVDDYGIWEGARKAVDDYCREAHLELLWLPHGTGRLALKIPAKDGPAQ